MELGTFEIFYYGSAVLVSITFSICILLIATSDTYPVIHRSKKEKCFTDEITGDSHQFPSIDDVGTLDLSVIVPAYNEEDRLQIMLDDCISYLDSRNDLRYEIIIVSDGSTDKTVEVAADYCKKLGTDKFRVLNLERNRGKGGAVRLGVQSARGHLILFADADGATKFSDLSKLESNLHVLLKTKNIGDVPGKLAISIGSRAHLEDESIATRSFVRTILMYGFHFLVWLFAVRGIRDTQCGFKLFTRESAKICFMSLHVERWAFDVELLYIAQSLKISIGEVCVNWTEIEGSKVTPFWSWLQMGRDLFLIWLRYRLGAWKILKQKVN